MRTSYAPILSVAALIGVSLLAAGCGGSATAAGTVSGPISVADKPVIVGGGGAAGAATTPSGSTTSGGGSTTSGGSTTTGGSTTAGGGGTTASAQGDPVAGKAVFTANCVACHTLKDAGSTGTVGPNLDDLKPAFATVQMQVTNGGVAMPAFKGTLSDADIANVAAYVSSVAGK